MPCRTRKTPTTRRRRLRPRRLWKRSGTSPRVETTTRTTPPAERRGVTQAGSEVAIERHVGFRHTRRSGRSPWSRGCRENARRQRTRWPLVGSAERGWNSRRAGEAVTQDLRGRAGCNSGWTGCSPRSWRSTTSVAMGRSFRLRFCDALTRMRNSACRGLRSSFSPLRRSRRTEVMVRDRESSDHCDPVTPAKRARRPVDPAPRCRSSASRVASPQDLGHDAPALGDHQIGVAAGVASRHSGCSAGG